MILRNNNQKKQQQQHTSSKLRYVIIHKRHQLIRGFFAALRAPEANGRKDVATTVVHIHECVCVTVNRSAVPAVAGINGAEKSGTEARRCGGAPEIRNKKG